MELRQVERDQLGRGHGSRLRRAVETHRQRRCAAVRAEPIRRSRLSRSVARTSGRTRPRRRHGDGSRRGVCTRNSCVGNGDSLAQRRRAMATDWREDARNALICTGDRRFAAAPCYHRRLFFPVSDGITRGHAGTQTPRRDPDRARQARRRRRSSARCAAAGGRREARRAAGHARRRARSATSPRRSPRSSACRWSTPPAIPSSRFSRSASRRASCARRARCRCARTSASSRSRWPIPPTATRSARSGWSPAAT